MPKRTNEFQKLVKLIQQSLAPKGAKITESAMLSAKGLKVLREIDVLIESEVGPFVMKIAVEAKDHKRKLDINDIEGIIGKYRGAGRVQVNKVVIVAHRGFTKSAIEKGRLEDMELLTLKEAEKVDWDKKTIQPVRQPRPLPEIRRLTIKPPLPPNIRKIALTEGRIISFFPDRRGQEKGSPRQIAEDYLFWKILTNPEWQTKISEKAKKQKGKTKVDFELKYGDAKIRFHGVDYPLKKIKAETEYFSPDCLPVFPPDSMQFEMKVHPHIAQVEIEPKPNVDDLQSLFKEGRLICKRSGKCHGHVFDYARKVLETKVLKDRPNLMNEIASCANKTQKEACVKVAFPIDNLELQYKGSAYPLEKMTIHLHAFLSSGKMAFKTYEIEGESLSCKSIQYGEAILGNKAVKMVLPEGLSSKQIILDIEDTQGCD